MACRIPALFSLSVPFFPPFVFYLYLPRPLRQCVSFRSLILLLRQGALIRDLVTVFSRVVNCSPVSFVSAALPPWSPFSPFLIKLKRFDGRRRARDSPPFLMKTSIFQQSRHRTPLPHKLRRTPPSRARNDFSQKSSPFNKEIVLWVTLLVPLFPFFIITTVFSPSCVLDFLLSPAAPLPLSSPLGSFRMK